MTPVLSDGPYASGRWLRWQTRRGWSCCWVAAEAVVAAAVAAAVVALPPMDGERTEKRHNSLTS